MKTYVLTLAVNFPATHSKKGQPTSFALNLFAGDKKHTIRGNYPFWKKRIQDVIAGDAVLSVRQWTGKPYNSPQQEVVKFTSEDPIGIQKLTIDPYLGYFIDDMDHVVTTYTLAENDGLGEEDFKEWFKGVKPDQEMAIIHFTNFRY